MTVAQLLILLLFAYVSHHICLALAATPPRYLVLPLSLDSLDLAGFEIAESPWLIDSTKTDVGAEDTSASGATELKWEFDEDLGRYYVSFPDDQQRSPVGTTGDLAFGVIFFSFGFVRSRTMCVL